MSVFDHLSPREQADLDERRKSNFFARLATIGVLSVILILVMLVKLWTPITGPWKQERVGMANYRQAAQERKITVEQARGELAAAKDQAAAIRTMGQAARDFPEYRTQMFIQAFNEALVSGNIGKIIYIPIETDLPITEAGRMAE
jgi:hypothetical protein